ncbi:hypothetical protein [Deinococcus enclensis]|uniref:Uncharacterized protein n=1 Tax=Deinococcus enclensis TaxID=1049582 RepID=A0ABT9MG57_9DEIO|nr:hypothetical protein [Deinococcus enclensis]MDP9765568.1 hypothetical protein [Deinococcus enclensis]
MPKARKSSPNRNRAIYAITSSQGTTEVEVATAAELREAMTPLLPGVDSVAVQAAAHLAVTERATITAPTWSAEMTALVTVQPVAAVQPGRRQTSQKKEGKPQATPPKPQPTEGERQDMRDTVFGEIVI